MSNKICKLCGREILDGYGNVHHMIPQLKGGKKGPTEYMHIICHSKIHSVLSESELAQYYNTIDRLQSHPEIVKFIKWIKKRPLDYIDSNRMSKSHKKKRKGR